MPLTSYNSRITAPVATANGGIPGDIVSISFSGFSASEIDVTQLTSTGKKYAMGRKDCGTCTIVTNVDPGSTLKPRVPVTAEPIYEYTMYLGSVAATPGTSGIKFLFDAFLQSATFDIATDDVVKATYTLQITGDLKATSLTYSAT